MDAIKKAFRKAMNNVDPDQVGGDAAVKVFALIYLLGLADGLAEDPSLGVVDVLRLVHEIRAGGWKPDASWRWW